MKSYEIAPGQTPLALVTLDGVHTVGYLPIDGTYCLILANGELPLLYLRHEFEVTPPYELALDLEDLYGKIDLPEIDRKLRSILLSVQELTADEADTVRRPPASGPTADTVSVLIRLMKKWDPDTYYAHQ